MSNQSSRGKDWNTLRTLILERDNYTCMIKGKLCTTEATHVDHITPKDKGGEDNEENLQASCLKCNTRKGTKVQVRTKRWIDTEFYEAMSKRTA